MAQATVQSTNALYAEDQIVYIASYSTSMTNDSISDLSGATWTNLGALTEFSREAKLETQQPPSMNVEHEQIISKMAETINVGIQELNMTNYNKLMGSVGYSTNTVGSATTAADVYSTGALDDDMFIKFKNQSWSSTHASIPISPAGIVVQASSTFALDADYMVMQNENLEWGIMLLSSGSFSTATTHLIKYSFVPKGSNILAFGGADELTPFMMKVYSIYADGRTLTSYYPRVEYVSGGAISDKDQASGAFKDMKFGLEAREHQSFTWDSKKRYRIDIQTTE